MRFIGLVLLTLVALAGALYGSAQLLTGSSGFARAVAWGESDIEDRHRFPARDIRAGGDPWPLPRARAPIRLDAFLEEHSTRAFIVLRRGRVVYERYFNGGSREGLETSFSVAKSFLSALIGIAIEAGAIDSLDERITRRLPELEERDPRFARIRIRDLLSMSSGLRYEEEGMPWSDDAETYYGTNLREVALEDTEIDQPPGTWHYNNFNPLLLGLILERATGISVARYMENRLWRPMGAEADGSWSLDSEDSGFEKMESGINARARDFARFGLLMLRDGRVERGRVLPPGWASTTTAEHSGCSGYGLGWWLPEGPGGGQRPFVARGKYGQVVAVDPRHQAVVVRLGSDDADVDWKAVALDVAGGESIDESAGDRESLSEHAHS